MQYDSNAIFDPANSQLSTADSGTSRDIWAVRLLVVINGRGTAYSSRHFEASGLFKKTLPRRDQELKFGDFKKFLLNFSES